MRLPVALRGYRFAETDLLLDRLAAELRVRDAEIERLRGHGVATAVAVDDPAEADSADEAQPDAGTRPRAGVRDRVRNPVRTDGAPDAPASDDDDG